MGCGVVGNCEGNGSRTVSTRQQIVEVFLPGDSGPTRVNIEPKDDSNWAMEQHARAELQMLDDDDAWELTARVNWDLVVVRQRRTNGQVLAEEVGTNGLG